ncbi:hypothetical protein DEU56DRAFT_918936 [Suillus clintonianus]|uniref:uncharacterized protein n=1 Tax=Suillus clintonianus TaxID=1904413 RepID=UPI001B870FF8|nr:uncharacterized protein DEU56DRAFT_918936 [Suillus clintonianus]KAG2118329.1 hypothetical protein DEU56DRAFT_918936 [Suillus clintonianus]
MESESESSGPASESHSEESLPPADPGFCLCEFCMMSSYDPFPPTSLVRKAASISRVEFEGGQKCLTVGAGVRQPHAQCHSDSAPSIVPTIPFTLGSPTVVPIPPPSPSPPLTSLTGALFRLPEALPLTITPYSTAEAEADIRWVHRDQAIYKEVIDAIADDCDVYLYHGMLYNMPAVPGKTGPYYCVPRGRYIGVFNTWDEVTESIKGFADVAYVVTSLAVGEVLIRTAIRRGEVHKCRV